ncbi:MAG: DUF1016 N-terminal domain-containing protein [bacterium]
MPKKKNDISGILTKEYAQILSNIKKRIKVAQVKAAFSVNEELIKLYWSIGKTIVEKQKNYDWGVWFFRTIGKRFTKFFSRNGWFFQNQCF